jgi:hypothetical protein
MSFIDETLTKMKEILILRKKESSSKYTIKKYYNLNSVEFNFELLMAS